MHRLTLIGTAALLLGNVQPVPAADAAGYSIMGFPVEGAYPFAVVHVSSNLQTMANGFFRLAVRIQASEDYQVSVKEMLIFDGDRHSSLSFNVDRDDGSGAVILRADGARRIHEGETLVIRFLVDDEPRTVTVNLIVQKLAF